MPHLHPRTWFVLYLALGLLVYAWFLNNPLLMDDIAQIVNNDAVHALSEWPGYFTSSSYGNGPVGRYYKPLMTTFYALVWSAFGPTPAAYRLPLLLLLVLSATLVMRWLRPHLGSPRAGLVGLIFLLHPINSELALYIADAQDVLYMFFGLGALVLVQRGSRWSILALALAALSKETGLLFVPVTATYAFYFRRERLRATLLGGAALVAAYAALRVSIGLTGFAVPELALHHATWLDRARTVPSLLWHYLEIFVWPWRISLTTDYVVQNYGFAEFWAPLLGVALAGILIWRSYARLGCASDRALARVFCAVLAVWFVLHGQVLVPLDGVYTDRWFTLGLLALTGFLALRIRPSTRMTWLLGGALALGYGARDITRGLDWADPLRLYSRELDLHPDDAIMANNVGVELFQRGRVADAKSYFERSLDLNPRWAVTLNNLGAVYLRGEDLARAEDVLERAVQGAPYLLAYQNFVRVLLRRGARARALAFLEQKGLRFFPNDETLRQLRAAL